MTFAKTLSRDEMKNVMAGTGCEGQCLFCSTPGGYQGWYRDDTSPGAEGECESIYEGYDAEDVQGKYDDCSEAPPTIPIICN